MNTHLHMVYFAWVRERIGKGEEDISPPDNLNTVQDLLDWLRAKGGGYAHALEDISRIRVAIDQEHADLADPIGTAREIALFPPVTGG